MELEFRSSNYSLIVEPESGKFSAYANFGSTPNLSALLQECWLNWIRFHFGLKEVTYGNTFFLTFLVIDDPYNDDIVSDVFEEIFLREPKIKYICTFAPPIDSIYEDILGVHCKQIFSLDKSMNKLSQSIFVCEKYNIISKMRLRRALSEDNDDLVEIIDQKFKSIRLELGEYYIAEQVMRNDPNESIVVAEISNNPIGMIWLNTRINQKSLADNFEIAAYGNFCKPHKLESNDMMESRNVIELIRKRSTNFFDKADDDRNMKQDIPSAEHPLSLNNFFIDTSSSNELNSTSDQFEENKHPKSIFKKLQQINKRFRSPQTYIEEVEKHIHIPKISEVTNAFAIQLFGLSSTIDPRRIYDLVTASFSSYPDKDYCIISLSSTEASSNSLNGPLLKYFSRVIPRVGCKISDCLYVAHKNSFLSEIEVSNLTNEDVADVEDILCHSAFKGNQIYNVADIMQSIEEYLTNQWSTYNILIIRSGGYAIGFVVLRQNCLMCEFDKNFVLQNDEELIPEWKSGELKYLHLHPAFIWEWLHVTREIFRLTGYSSLFYKLKRESSQPILNSILLNMLPLFPRKQIYETRVDPYALYHINIKKCHMVRLKIESKIVIVGFNETCKGFLRTLLFSPSSMHIQCFNITVITECNGFIEAEYDIRYFEKQQLMFFQANNQFSADFLRKLEFRTWVNFVAGGLKEINGDDKTVILENGTVLQYDRLILMSLPKPLKILPPNYLEVNSRLDKIIFYHKIQLLKMEASTDLPLLIYGGSAAMAHSCLNTLIDMEIKPTHICLVITTKQTNNFPETFDDEYVTKWLYTKEIEAGVQIYRNLKFISWNLYPNEEAIESVVFESDDCGKITLSCLALINFCAEEFSEDLKQASWNSAVEILNNKIVIDENSKTNIPCVYACGRTTQFNDKLLPSQSQPEYLNQTEVGNQLAMSFIEEQLTGLEENMLKVNFVKPIFRQYQLIEGYVYGGLRKPGRYVSRQIRKDLQLIGKNLTTYNEYGEYCRVCLDQNGFVCEITCITKKYNNLEILYRIYGLHEKYFNNLRIKCERGEIENLLDYFHQNTFSAILHDQFVFLRQTIRKKNLDCLKGFLGDMKKIDKFEILTYLQEKNMNEVMQNELIGFIKNHSKSLHPHYALPDDFSM